MCKDCGCGIEGSATWHHHGDGKWHSHDEHSHDHEHHHHHDHSHDHGHSHAHQHASPMESAQAETNPVENTPAENTKTKNFSFDPVKAVLARNDQIAQNNRLWFFKNKILALNMISSPGSGKTLLLEKILPLLASELKTSVLVGDQATALDADRLLHKGAAIKQINTPNSCHLDAPHIESELSTFVGAGNTDVLIIENVGNLVCPSMFDLGESAKIALLSCAEGEDKPLKYPSLFSQASLVMLTKMDLAPHLNWSLDKTLENIRRLNSFAPILITSAQSGSGLDSVVAWIKQRHSDLRATQTIV